MLDKVKDVKGTVKAIDSILAPHTKTRPYWVKRVEFLNYCITSPTRVEITNVGGTLFSDVF